MNKSFHADIAVRPFAAPGFGIQTGSVLYGGPAEGGQGTNSFDFTFDNSMSSWPIDFPFFGSTISSYIQITLGIAPPFIGTVFLDNIQIQ